MSQRTRVCRRVAAALAVALAALANAEDVCRADTACAPEPQEDASLLQRASPSKRAALITETSMPTCAIGQAVQCPGSGVMCAGDQCCPGGDGMGSFPCPSASPGFRTCQSQQKVANCVEHGDVGPPKPKICMEGESVECPGSRGVMCAGNQCCPGAYGGPTFPCPSASTDFNMCQSPKKVESCLDQDGGFKPSKVSALAGKSVYFAPVDRFARNPGSPTEPCNNDNHWCNGTLRGLTDHLDYIQGMGFDCLWITPVVYQYQGETPSGTGCMGYWAYNLYEIDPHFGTKQDLKDLVKGLHDRGMCIVYDFVANHMGPIHNEHMVHEMVPFNETKYFHQLFRGDLTFDEYTEKSSNWPPPAQAMWSQSGAQCTQGVDCSCYTCPVKNLGPFESCPEPKVFNPDSPCPKGALSPYCMPGDYGCVGYNETITQQGWFYDLGDLNQTDPYVRRTQLEWIAWFVKEYDIDLLRLDTAAFMTFDFLSQLQQAAGVPIIGEVTTTNMTYHAQFQANPPAFGEPVLNGVLNFPIYYTALSGFCGTWFPYSTFNLTFLAQRVQEQLFAAPYTNLDTLGNFIDNHDVPRVADACKDLTRIYNALAFTMLSKGVPIVYYGTEELFTIQRESLWSKGYNTSTEPYQLIKSLNMIRKAKHIELSGTKVLRTTDDNTMVFIRLGEDQYGDVWVFLNNFDDTAKTVTYCTNEFPGYSWEYDLVDAISGEVSSFDAQGCWTAADAYPKVLVKVFKESTEKVEKA